MGKPTGFVEFQRELPGSRSVEERIGDWNEVYLPFPDDKLQNQGARCMDCGIPFCHSGCPLGNLIPEWNDMVYREKWDEAVERLHRTNNFPEFTGRLCPAPCEGSCVLGINEDPVTIKQIEVSIIEHAFDQGWVVPRQPAARTGKKVAIVGSGPAGLAAADQLNQAGHSVTVFERDSRIGGLMRYGIPEFKMEKKFLDRRLELMESEGVVFKTGCHVGVDVTASALREEFDALVLAGGARAPRDLPIPGRDLKGVYFALEYLSVQNKLCEGVSVPVEEQINVKGKSVIVIGGGDTGADCLGTAHRQGATSIHQLEILPCPPDERDANVNPWPLYPDILRVSSAHEEGGDRIYSISTKQFVGEDGVLKKLDVVDVEMKRSDDGRMSFEDIPGTEREMNADFVFLAMGFLGPERKGMIEELGVELTERGNVQRDEEWMTSVPGVFTVGDMQRGQSLIVWAIAEGRSCARAVDMYLMGESDLPAPI
ncbi:MAG: glutamate synthase subunit beta [Nitrospinota bacterium]|jgi:glutamate synthase (NADPH/NADH) small chain|nr:glutamate synthase subunit beta [Nitrospinota bacterium]MDP7505348.1 glutamate synthase subunit beta [Nitrospinota bacterium]MDP7663894.1 glutamate synthase subunit beta [Nitrospinota bacterium]